MKDEGLHEIKNKYRARAVNKKRKGLVFTAKKKRRALKACASLSAIFLLLLGAFAIGSALLSSVVPNVVPDDFVTVSYKLPDDGSKPTDHSALENIGYMNYRFKNQPSWYMEMHGTTATPVGPQSVNTFKQYSDGVLIMSDVTSSSIMKAGRQFCYVGDEVMWREIPKSGSFKADSYDDLTKLTFNDELEAHMTISAFKAKNGLPGTELTVYIINEETLDHADEVEIVSSADWDEKDFVEKPVYRQTYYLRPGDSDNLGAAAHYANQMAFTGGLTGLPEFNYIKVTYTFDSSWQVLRAEVDESYKATMGITVTCSSSFTSNYEYGTERAKSDAYENYFKDFVGVGIDDNVKKPLDSLNCITSAFLTKPVAFELDLEIDGKKTNGIISLDASKLDISKIMGGGSVDIGAALGCIGLKAKIGDIHLYLEDSTAYLAAGDLKAKLPVNDLLSMVTGATAQAASEPVEENSEEAAPIFDLDDPVLSEGGTLATVSAKLDLSSLGVDLKMPLNFKFRLDEAQNASLENLGLSFDYRGIKAKAGLRNTGKSVPELVDKDSFIDLYPYAEAVYSLVSGGKLDIGLDYANDDMSLAGSIAMDFTDGFTLAGELTLNVRESAKAVKFAILNGVAYVDIDGIKLSASLSEAMNLVKGFLSTGKSDSGELKNIIDKALGAVFDNDLASLLSLTESDNALSLGVKGTQLLKAFGFDYKLGDVDFSIDKTSGAITATVDGRKTLAVKTLEKDIAFDTAGYTELTGYAQALVNLFTGESVTVEVSYKNRNLTVAGNIVIGLSPLSVSGSVTLTYGALEKNVEIVYGEDGYLYLVLDSLKIKADTKEAAKIISSLTAKDETEKKDIYDTLQKVLSVDFGEMLSIFETTEGENTELNAVLDGTKLLNLFGVDFKLGEITLTVGAEKVTASALGANISLVADGEVKTLSEKEKETYVDLKPVLDALPEILEKKALALDGKVVLNTGDIDVLLSLDRGVLSFANGFKAYFDLSLVMTEATIDLQLYIDTSRVKIALGNLGAEIAFSELSSLGDAVASLYEEVRKTLNPISENELLPEAKTIKDIFDLLGALLPGSDEAGIDHILSGLSIENSKEANGLFAIEFMGASLDIIKEARGFIGARVRFGNESLSVSGELGSAVFTDIMPEMPALDYLNESDFEELLDYLVAALHTLAENNINLNVSGVIGADDTEKYPDGVKYNLSGDIRLYSGESTAIHLNLDKKSLWVDTDTYLYAKIELDPVSAEDKGLYLEFFLLDCDEEGNADGILDVFVSVSFFGEGDARRAPFTLYAPANELMPILSSALALFGVDIDIVNDYVLAPWLSVETAAQLKGFGNSLMPLLGGLMGGSSDDSEKTAFDVNALISSIQVGDKSFSLALDGKTIFGKEGEPLTVTIGKEQTENGSRLTALSVANIGNTSVSVGLTYEEKERLVPSFKGMIPMKGIASLLQTIARSATHRAEGEVISGEETKHEYVLNENFYIDGSILLDVNAIGILKEKLNIKVVAFSITIDEEGVWGVNVRFEYDAVKVLGITAINGNTQVDLTGKDNMVYIKRVQTTDDDGKSLPKPVVLYRAMPLKNFVNDLIGQAGFMFNLGSKITGLLPKNMGGGSTQKEEVDLGTTVSNILKSIDYTNGGNGETWVVTLNGAGLTNGTLGDIVLAFGSDGEGKLRTLTAHTSLSTTGISMAVDADLTYRNPCGAMDEGVKDITTDIAALLTDGMSYKLETVDWENTTFIEGEYTSVEYILMGEVIKTQYIVIATGVDGDEKGTVYGTLAYPDLAPYNTEKGYMAEWVVYYGKDDPLPESRQIFARYNPLTYSLTFELKGESVTLEYLYGDENFALPFRADEAERVAYFTDEAGNKYSAAEDLKRLSGNATLTAVYEKVEYTVTFVVGDEKTEQKANYGDTVAYPASPERVGYAFAGWDSEEMTVTGDLTITALWTANTYSVTLVSKHAIDGYTWNANADGDLVTTFAFTYDSAVTLPRGARVTEGDKTYVLRGFCVNGVCYFDYLPNVTENTVFTAQWEELGFDIVFVTRAGEQITLNYHGGDTIESSAIPSIAARDGYTSFWQDKEGNLITGDYYVTGETQFTVLDVANTYLITLASTQPYAGFALTDGVYTKTLSYTYDGAAVVLDALNDIHGYWFKGYYTEANGEGVKTDKVENILDDTTLYVYWQDNTVTVNICSDIPYAGAGFDIRKNAYAATYTFNDNYALSEEYLPTVDGYQTLALWVATENGYARVTNVRDLDGADLWVLWIKNIKVTVTDFSGSKTYTVKGFVEGGSVYGDKSNEIFTAIGGTVETVGQYSIFSGDGKHTDNLKYNKEVAIDEKGEFGDADMTSFNGLFFTADYGGILITKKFTYTSEDGKSMTISTANASYVSKAAYTVKFVGEYGMELKTVKDVRMDYPYDSYDNATYLDDIAPALPEKFGYTVTWDREITHTPITENITVNAVYTPVVCSVTLRGGIEFKDAFGWHYDNVEDDYYAAIDANFGATVSVIYRGETVSFEVGLGENVFDLTALASGKVLYRYEATLSSVTVELQNSPDRIVLNSPVAFALDGDTDTNHTVSFDMDYTLPTVSAKGYTFLGWYEMKDGAWLETTMVSYMDGGNTVTVEALWASELKVEITSRNRKYNANTSYTHTASAKVSGGALVGAFANEATATMSIRYYANDNTDYNGADSSNHGYSEYSDYRGEERTANFSHTFGTGWVQKKYAHIVGTVTWTYAGFSWSLGEQQSNGDICRHVYVSF